MVDTLLLGVCSTRRRKGWLTPSCWEFKALGGEKDGWLPLAGSCNTRRRKGWLTPSCWEFAALGGVKDG
jgi:hypothetical protein